jgi:hypothetical protein
VIETAARARETLWCAVGELLEHFSPEECAGHIHHSSYRQSG